VAYPEIRPADPGETGVRALILAEARGRDYRRVSLETGAMAAFAPARALYESAGFTPCPPFADYVAGENSVYLSLPLLR
jgi:putative acetyltransferase